jgi:hypothetical protein
MEARYRRTGRLSLLVVILMLAGCGKDVIIIGPGSVSRYAAPPPSTLGCPGAST